MLNLNLNLNNLVIINDPTLDLNKLIEISIIKYNYKEYQNLFNDHFDTILILFFFYFMFV